MHELLVNRLFKPAQEKVWLGPAMTIAVILGRKATKQNKQTKIRKRETVSYNKTIGVFFLPR